MKKENSEYDIRCTRCGRHVNQLEPFDVDENLSVTFISQNKLVKKCREIEFISECKLCEEILQKFAEGIGKTELINVYGSKNVEAAIYYEEHLGYVETSWECRECINEEGPYKHYLENTN